MSFGLNVTNDYGYVLIDENLPQAHFVEAGTAPTSGVGMGSGTITFSRSITNPLIFARAAVGVVFHFFETTSTTCTYTSNGPIEYRVYEVAEFAVAPVGFGMTVFNAAGAPIFSSSTAPADIRQVSTALLSTDPLPTTRALSTYVVRTIGFSVTAFDGGLPFVSESTFVPCFFAEIDGFTSYYILSCKFTSTTSLEIIAKPYDFGADENWRRVEQDTRDLFFIR